MVRAADEAAELGWPAPVRTAVPVNSTVPARRARSRRTHWLGQPAAGRRRSRSPRPAAALADDLARVEAVRDALGPARPDPGRRQRGLVRATRRERAIRELRRFDLEYVEQPCRTVEELAELRRRLARSGVDVLIAADESIRRADDPYLVRARGAADVAVLKVQPLGGVRACLEIAERIGLPVVVSSALETSIGLRAGLALAAALPELPYACGLNTGRPAGRRPGRRHR